MSALGAVSAARGLRRGPGSGEPEGTRQGRGPELYVSPRLLIAAAVLTGTVFGRFMADGHMKIAAALVLAACYAPLVLFDLAIALAAYIAVQFFQDLSIFSSGPNAMGVLVGLGWIGAVLGRRGRVAALAEHRRTILALVVFCAWLSMSIGWAQRPGPAGTEASYWWIAALAFAVALTAPASPRALTRLALAFVAGSVISVAIGVLTGSLSTAETAISQTAIQGRFTGGGGDPNVQAAGFVAAMFLIIGLLGLYRRRAPRLALIVSFVLVTIGFLATESRGGLIALVVGVIVALFIAPRHRGRIIALGAVMLAAILGLGAAQPGAIARITDLGGGSSGRSDLWRVGWQVFTGHPLAGVGIGNFQVVESHYTLRPGAISRIQYLVDVPHLVHNTYLQLLAETGIIGLGLYLLVLACCVRATWSAIRRFESIGSRREADLARAVLMGIVGMSVALFFISDGDDVRLWVLLAMGPALSTFATRAARQAAPAIPVRPLPVPVPVAGPAPARPRPLIPEGPA
jgi:O-antigen ligase